MTELEKKIWDLLIELSQGERYDFAAILHPKAFESRWDLAVSAPWIDKHTFIRQIAPRLSEVLSGTELMNLGAVIVLDPEGEFMQHYYQHIGPSEKDKDLFELIVGEVPVRHAHVFGTQSPLARAA